MKDLIILGTGGNCIDILDAVLALNESGGMLQYRVRGFLDDNKEVWGQEVQGCRVLGPLSHARNYSDCLFANGIGSFHNYWRKPDIIATTGLPDEAFVSIVHPRASVSRFAALGRGTVVLQNATINSGVRVGCHVIILPNAVLSHDTVVGDHTCIASSACLAGGVQIGKACYLGAQCAVSNGVRIGDFSLAGIGAVVLQDVPPKTVVVGNPARVTRQAF
ncbi:MAG TPA: NeuD/PglB/VioB family sugar acetyltransferase [Candidatus Binatia bacterium]|jgi:sugar O-acyltransferase (sialic acid O-acetyltransferase NeuD family)|nr:NeuD/PglB/VioB family sugar acetyltransferase [Candidatus Binatia bacterium]